ncbi:hypothetical protein [Actinoplanes sp. NPDC049681]|uniref:hypothetical protein n=1 Tax=Actinoplanes sp. NPDC049681 TaxID=3363905 RepID=UPI00379E88EB
MTGTTGSARQEAERLVAALLAMASQGRGEGGLGDMLTGVAGQFFSGTGSQQHKSSTGWATGTAECCVCPICRAIAALRDPTPETAERLATGAGDLAAGVASMMRAFSTIAGASGSRPKPKTAPRPEPTPDQAWSTATRAGEGPVAPAQPDETADPWGAATRSPAPTRGPAGAGHEAGARAGGRAAAEAASTGGRRPAAASGGPLSRTEKADSVNGGPLPRAEESDVAKHTRRRDADPWAAAVANYAKEDSPGETGVVGSRSVDHDVSARGTPAAAEDHGSRPGDDAPGDVV